MQNIHKVLFVCRGDNDDSDGLAQALDVSRTHDATLTVLALGPELPNELDDYRELFEDALRQRAQSALGAACEALGDCAATLCAQATVEVECGATPAERIIRRAMTDGFDMVMKNVEADDSPRGFKALDMELLRKCPCPVWLCRPVARPASQRHVLLAIDPDCSEPNAYDLAINLLQLSRQLADREKGVLHIVSCWDYDLDAYLRSRVPVGISDEELERITEQAGASHRAKMDVLIRASGIEEPFEVLHRIARPEQYIPQLIDDGGYDLLVMGTVARTGIPGFLMGNTAENILQKVGCSLLALKPGGFSSPVKP